MRTTAGKAQWSIVICAALVMVCVWAGSVTAQSYELGVGDMLRITVWGHEDLMTEVEVRPDGYIGFPLVGDLYVVGRTTSWVSDTVEERLDNYVKDPKVTVIVIEFRTIRVQAMGEVVLTGYYEMRAGARVWIFWAKREAP